MNNLKDSFCISDFLLSTQQNGGSRSIHSNTYRFSTAPKRDLCWWPGQCLGCWSRMFNLLLRIRQHLQDTEASWMYTHLLSGMSGSLCSYFTGAGRHPDHLPPLSAANVRAWAWYSRSGHQPGSFGSTSKRPATSGESFPRRKEAVLLEPNDTQLHLHWHWWA